MPMRFVTRSKVHVDRIATVWAIQRFIDPDATFVFVDRNADVSSLDAIPFDMRGAELGHHAGRCTFEALLESYELRDPALRRMGEIVRAIDVPLDSDRKEDTAALTAAFNGLRDADLGDDERLLRGQVICEELYVTCGGARREVQE
jgi:hypothetical protein